MKTYHLLTLAALFALAACSADPGLTRSGLDPEKFRSEVDGRETDLYTLTNDSGMEVCITNFGGRIVSVMVPDRDGILRDVVLGFDNISDYVNIASDFGASIGRYANRIDKGRITLGGETIQLPVNNYGHCLHGGPQGWQYKVYDAEQLGARSLRLTLDSPDGDANFPGNVNAEVLFTLTDEGAIDIAYCATTDKPTIINMTNHAYFNLSGDPSRAATDHILFIDADSYTPVDSTFMTTGEILPVAGTPMDFTAPKAVGRDIEDDFVQLANGHGYDHNWVLNTAGDADKVAASLYSPVSGIRLDVYTTEPGIQVYSGNFLDGTVTGKNGVTYNRRASVCLETQHFPDSPNKPDWPSVVLNPGERYTSFTSFRFSVN